MIRKFALAAVAMFAFAGFANAAGVDGTQAILTSGISTVPSGGAIDTATDFSFSALTDFGGTSQTGDFIGFPAFTFLGNLSFNTTTGLSFSQAALGSFSTISVIPLDIQTNTVTYYLLGTFTPGSFFGPGPFAAQPASLTIQFNQTAGGSIGGGATLATPPAPIVPEPSTVASAVAGLLFAGFAARRRLAK